MRTSLSRGLLGIVTALGLLVALAAPASASPGTTSGGSEMDLTINPIEVYNYSYTGGPPPGAPCPPSGLTFVIDIDFATLTVTPGLIWKEQVQVPPGGGWYWRNVSIVSGTVSISLFPPSISLTITRQISFHPIGSCSPKSPAVCTLRTTSTLTGTWSGATASPPGTAVVSGGPSNIVRAGACAAPFATRYRATAPFAQNTILGWTIQF